MEVEVRTSRRRTMALEVQRDGTVLVRAPIGTPQSTIERFVKSHGDWIRRAVEKQTLRRQSHPDPSQEEEKHLRKLAHEVLPGRVSHWAKIMGVTPTGLRITSARTRFGSCSGKNAVSLSWRLMQYPPEAIDYVVVHELSHIRHHDHSAAFWTEVARYMPDYAARKRLLK